MLRVRFSGSSIATFKENWGKQTKPNNFHYDLFKIFMNNGFFFDKFPSGHTSNEKHTYLFFFFFFINLWCLFSTPT